MRNTKQGPSGQEGGDNITLQQLMETVPTIQEAVATSKADQVRLMVEVQAEQVLRQDQFILELDASRASNEELRKASEDLHRDLQWLGECCMGERCPMTEERARPMAFSQKIMDAVVPTNFVTPKIPRGPSHNVQHSDDDFGRDRCHAMQVIHGHVHRHNTTVVVGLPDGHITSFDQFSAFKEQFIVNRAQLTVSFDLFRVKQRQGEPLKDFLNRFGAFVVNLQKQDEALMVHAFEQGILSGPFSDSLIRNWPRTFGEIRRRTIAHIAAEEAVMVKRGSLYSGQAKPRESGRAQPMRVHEVVTRKRPDARRAPYAPRKNQTRSKAKDDLPFRPKFKMSYKELLAMLGMADQLRFPLKFYRNLGPHKGVWCDFHQAFGHDVENCIALGYQLAGLVKDGLMKEYLAGSPEGTKEELQSVDQRHEVVIHDEINTISKGFLGGGCTTFQRGRYAREVMKVEAREPDQQDDPDLCFTKADLRGVVPHEDDPVVISVMNVDKRVHRVLIDQGSSIDVIFWGTFNKLQLSPDQLRRYEGCLFGFAGDQVEVRGHVELRTTFLDGTSSRTINIRYLVVNTTSAYNILFRQTCFEQVRRGGLDEVHEDEVALP